MDKYIKQREYNLERTMLVFLLLINIVSGEDIHLGEATFNTTLVEPRGSSFYMDDQNWGGGGGWTEQIHKACTPALNQVWVKPSDGTTKPALGASAGADYTYVTGSTGCDDINKVNACITLCSGYAACDGVNFNHKQQNNQCQCFLWGGCDWGNVATNENVHVFLKHTAAPTTAAPTTAAPTTAAPTTAAPTTAAPTTAAPTTAAPTAGPHEVVFEVGFDNGYHGQTGGSFQNAVKVAVSAALGVSQSEFTFSDVLPGPGTVRVLFRVTSFPTLSAQESQDIFDQIITNFAGSGDSNLVAISKKPITVSNIGETDLEFTRAPTNSDPTSSPTTKSPTTSAPVTRSPTIPGYTYAPTGHPTEFPTEAPTLPPTVPPPPPVNILQTTVEEKCTVSDFTKIMLAVASTLCGLVAFMAITFWFILERSRGGSGFSSGRVAPSGTFAEVGQPVGHSLFKSRKMKGTPEETQGLVNRRGGDREV